MLDTTKYKGHTPGPWNAMRISWDENRDVSYVLSGVKSAKKADAELISDAPLLLAECKRLQEMVEKMKCCGNCKNYPEQEPYLSSEILGAMCLDCIGNSHWEATE